MKKTFLKRGACVVAFAALVGAMVPAMALATDQTTTGGTEAVTSNSVEVVYEKDCAWTATYPTSVTLPSAAAGTETSAEISFSVKGLIDTDHVVTITPTDATITLNGAKSGNSNKIEGVAITGGTAAAAAVNTEAGATVAGSAKVTVPTGLAVDKYSGTTTFKIQCAKPAATECTLTLVYDDGSDSDVLSVNKGATYTISESSKILTVNDKQYGSNGSLIWCSNNSAWYQISDGQYTISEDTTLYYKYQLV